MNAAEPDLLTVQEVARRLRVAVTTVRRYLNAGKLEAVAGDLEALAAQGLDQVGDVLRRSDVNARLHELMLEPVGSTPAEAADFFASETALWGKLIKDTGAKAQ